MTAQDAPPATPPLPPRAALLQLFGGEERTQQLYVMAKLGIADALADGPQPSAEVARRVGAHPDALHRLLRALVMLDLLTHADDGRFGLTPTGDLLRSEVPGSFRRTLVEGVELYGPVWAALLHTVQSGETAFDHVYGTSFFDYLAQHPEASAGADASFARTAMATAPALLAAYDFSSIGTLIDVGGNTGILIAAILRAHPAMRGVLFDQPHVVQGAAAVLTAAGVADRCRVVGGDFFVGVPSGGDAYLLASIIHDWDDARSASILRNCRVAMAEPGRLLVLERVMPERITAPNGPTTQDDPVRADMSMLTITGGRERTAAEYRALLAATGFTLTRVVPFPSVRAVSLIEAVPV